VYLSFKGTYIIYIYIYTHIKRGELFGRNGDGCLLKCTSVRGHSLLIIIIIIIIHTFTRPLSSVPQFIHIYIYICKCITNYMPSRPNQKALEGGRNCVLRRGGGLIKYACGGNKRANYYISRLFECLASPVCKSCVRPWVG